MSSQNPTPAPPDDTHPDVEYHVSTNIHDTREFDKFDDAAGCAVYFAASAGVVATIDVVISSEQGAAHYGGDDAVQFYLDDPERSVHERLELSVNCAGGIP